MGRGFPGRHRRRIVDPPAHQPTLIADSQPQSTPVWCEFDGEHVAINSPAGHQKDNNLARDGRVAESIVDPDNPYHYLEVRGRVVARTPVGADEQIDHLAQIYLGTNYSYRSPGEQRMLYKILPIHATSMGSRRLIAG